VGRAQRSDAREKEKKLLSTRGLRESLATIGNYNMGWTLIQR
jgi:hypothetical protein